jgi:hypothetical protein
MGARTLRRWGAAVAVAAIVVSLQGVQIHETWAEATEKKPLTGKCGTMQNTGSQQAFDGTMTRGTFSDWLGVFLDPPGDAADDWAGIAEILEDAFRRDCTRDSHG